VGQAERTVSEGSCRERAEVIYINLVWAYGAEWERARCEWMGEAETKLKLKGRGADWMVRHAGRGVDRGSPGEPGLCLSTALHNCPTSPLVHLLSHAAHLHLHRAHLLYTGPCPTIQSIPLRVSMSVQVPSLIYSLIICCINPASLCLLSSQLSPKLVPLDCATTAGSRLQTAPQHCCGESIYGACP